MLKAYSYYWRKIKKKVAKKHQLEKKEFDYVARKIFKKLSEKIAESPSGVIVPRVGYFAHWMTPEPIPFFALRSESPIKFENWDTDGYWYETHLFADVVNRSILRGWEFTFSSEIKRQRFKKLKGGMRYRLHYHALKNLYGNNN